MIKHFVSICIFLSALGCTAQQQPVRGVWLTNVGSDALASEQNIAAAVNRCSQLGMNTIYVVVWNKGVTLYPSPVAKKYIGIAQDTAYNFDPIGEVIRQAHEKSIRVIGWFEFGFAYDYNDSNSVWLQKYPHWAGRDVSGALLQKNKFFWWNALYPEVQQFMDELILDFVTRYDADGIQGDDRLPAMPAEGGYDGYTRSLFAREHGGAVPPVDCKDSAWVQWRAGKLSAYAKQLYVKIKAVRRDCVVSWAPSIYPWSKEHYLQDWPAWLNGGYADELLPQLYRYDISAYEEILKQLNDQLTTPQKKKVFPGILVALSDGYRITQHMLDETIRLNRRYGFAGECSFYYEGLKQVRPYHK